MTPAEAAVLAAARGWAPADPARSRAGVPWNAQEDSDLREAWLASNLDVLAGKHARTPGGIVGRAKRLGLISEAEAQALFPHTSEPISTAVAKATVRPWPDPEAYKALACEVFGGVDLPRDVPSAVAAWKALQDGQRVMCARGYQWTADRSGGRLRFTMAKQDGRPGKTLEQPWYPCIVGKLPVWPIVIEAAGD